MNDNNINNCSRLILKRILGFANIIVNVYLDFLVGVDFVPQQVQARIID